MVWCSEVKTRATAARLVHELDSVTPVNGADGWSLSASFVAAASDPVFAGHFPGHPTLPGVYHLEAVLQTLRLASGVLGSQPLWCTRIDDFRLLQAVAPGGTVTIALQLRREGAQGDVQARAMLTAEDGRSVARLSLRMSQQRSIAGELAACVTPGGAWIRLAPHEILRRLPHRHPILLIDEALVEPGMSRLVATKYIALNEPCYRTHQHPQSAELAYPATLILESWLQSAALLGNELPGVTAEALPVLGSIRQIDWFDDAYAGERLRHEVSVRRVLSGAALIDGLVVADGRPILALTEALIAMRSPDAMRAAAGAGLPVAGSAAA